MMSVRSRTREMVSFEITGERSLAWISPSPIARAEELSNARVLRVGSRLSRLDDSRVFTCASCSVKPSVGRGAREAPVDPRARQSRCPTAGLVRLPGAARAPSACVVCPRCPRCLADLPTKHADTTAASRLSPAGAGLAPTAAAAGRGHRSGALARRDALARRGGPTSRGPAITRPWAKRLGAVPRLERRGVVSLGAHLAAPRDRA